MTDDVTAGRPAVVEAIIAKLCQCEPFLVELGMHAESSPCHHVADVLVAAAPLIAATERERTQRGIYEAIMAMDIRWHNEYGGPTGNLDWPENIRTRAAHSARDYTPDQPADSVTMVRNGVCLVCGSGVIEATGEHVRDDGCTPDQPADSGEGRR